MGQDALGLGLWFLFRLRFVGGLGLFLRFRSGVRLRFAFWLSDGLAFGDSLRGSGLSLRFGSPCASFGLGRRLRFAFRLSDGLAFRDGLGFGNSLGLFPLLKAVPLEEALHPASRVHDAVLAGEERMTPAAYLDVQMRLGGAGLEGVAAGADDGRFYVLWMDIRLHGRPQLLLGA